GRDRRHPGGGDAYDGVARKRCARYRFIGAHRPRQQIARARWYQAMTSLRRSCLAVVVISTLSGCAAAPSKVDPFEPFNRTMYSVHEAIDKNFMKPVAQGYVKVTPEPVRTGVSNFFGNIDDLITG